MVTPELALEWAPPNDPRLPAMLGVLRDDAQQVGDLAVSILDVLFRHWDDIDADSDDHDSIHAAKDADLSWAGFGVLFVSLECMLRFSIEAVVERFAVSRVATKRIVHYYRIYMLLPGPTEYICCSRATYYFLLCSVKTLCFLLVLTFQNRRVGTFFVVFYKKMSGFL
eukprot:GEMP01113584.1.p1 GENE.GEMP01113584.1~~GEMP01113584.1.p1  ORF type:complete len:168 (+),score=29.43 GEMP01113584.1:102-605(+)